MLQASEFTGYFTPYVTYYPWCETSDCNWCYEGRDCGDKPVDSEHSTDSVYDIVAPGNAGIVLSVGHMLLLSSFKIFKITLVLNMAMFLSEQIFAGHVKMLHPMRNAC